MERGSDLHNVARSFFESVPTKQARQQLDLMMDVYIQHADVERMDLANTISIGKAISEFLIDASHSVQHVHIDRAEVTNVDATT